MSYGPVPTLAGTGRALPEVRLEQSQSFEILRRLWDRRKLDYDEELLAHFFESVGVDRRHLALAPEEYLELEGFGETNDRFVEAGTQLGAEALQGAASEADLAVGQLDALFFTTVTGVASPSLDAKIANELELAPAVRRVPMFGLGCVGGAAGLSRMADYLRAYPDHAAGLVAVEICSLTVERDVVSVADHVAAAIFGDGAMAAVGVGGARTAPTEGPRMAMCDSHRRLYPETEWVMGWEIDATGFNLVLSGDLPEVVEEELGPLVGEFLAAHDLGIDAVRNWIVHPGGPAVLEAVERAGGLDDGALEVSRTSLREVGNLSSASVLHVAEQTYESVDAGAEPGPDVLMAMGPGFCVEMVLLEEAHR